MDDSDREERLKVSSVHKYSEVFDVFVERFVVLLVLFARLYVASHQGFELVAFVVFVAFDCLDIEHVLGLLYRLALVQ